MPCMTSLMNREHEEVSDRAEVIDMAGRFNASLNTTWWRVRTLYPVLFFHLLMGKLNFDLHSRQTCKKR